MATFFHVPTPAAMRMASAGRGLVRGSLRMMKSAFFNFGGTKILRRRPSIEAEEPIGARHDVVDHGQAGKNGFIAHGDVAAIGAVSAGVKFKALLAQCL